MSYNQVIGFCSHLTSKYYGAIPKGTFFRLPSEAEWEYALIAGCDDPNDPYVVFRSGLPAEAAAVEEDIGISSHTIRSEMLPLAQDWIQKRADERGGAIGRLRYFIGKRKPNHWGIHDMLSNGAEYTLDTVWHPGPKDGKDDYKM